MSRDYPIEDDSDKEGEESGAEFSGGAQHRSRDRRRFRGREVKRTLKRRPEREEIQASSSSREVKSLEQKRRLRLYRGGVAPVNREDRSVDEHDRTLQIPTVDRRLDAIARLIRGEEACCAVCFDKRNKRILVANNTGINTPLTEHCFEFFRSSVCEKYSLDDLGDQEEVLQQSWGEIMNLAMKSYDRVDDWRRLRNLESVVDGRVSDTRRREIIDEEIKLNKVCIDEAGEEGERRILNMNEEILKEIRDSGDNDFIKGIAEVLREGLLKSKRDGDAIEPRLWDDLEKITRSLAVDSPMETAFPDTTRLALRKSFRDGGVFFVEGKPGLHAEMRILEEMIDEHGNLMADDSVYIGITKLCCMNCNAMVKALNKIWGEGCVVEVSESEEIGEERRAKVSTRGTHCRLYQSWVEPPFLDRVPGLRDGYMEELGELQEAAIAVKPELPELSPSPPRRELWPITMDAQALSAVPLPDLGEARRDREKYDWGVDSSGPPGASPEAQSPDREERMRRSSSSSRDVSPRYVQRELEGRKVPESRDIRR